MSRVVFVGGVPGSGKTTFCRNLARQARWQHVGAGELIAEQRALVHSAKYERPLVADGTQANAFQELLLAGLSRRCEGGHEVLLDGHFVVPTSKGPVEVPLWTFERMAPDTLCLVSSPPEIVAGRLAVRPPSWWDGTVDAIAALMTAEAVWAQAVGEALGLSLHLLDGTASEPVQLTWSPRTP